MFRQKQDNQRRKNCSKTFYLERWPDIENGYPALGSLLGEVGAAVNIEAGTGNISSAI